MQTGIAAHRRVVLAMLIIACMSLSGCRPRSNAKADDASVADAAPVVVSVSPPKRRGPEEPSPPLASQAAAEVPKALEGLKADKAYAALWDAKKAADLSFFLSCVSYTLATLPVDAEKSELLVNMYEQLKKKKQDNAWAQLMFVSSAAGRFPEEFVTSVQALLATVKDAPHLGTWSESKQGKPEHDYSALAFHLNPENADYLREMIAARRKKGGGPFAWASGERLRPWLARERPALATLGRLATLTAVEKARLADLTDSPLGDDPGDWVELSDLLHEYKSNEVRADGKFKGKVIRLSGIARDIKKNAFDQIYVVISNGGEFEHPNVHCSVSKRLEAKASEFDKGDKITIRGKVTGMVIGSVMIDACEFED